MKHLKLFFALFAMLALGVSNVWAETATITFKNQSSGTSDGSTAYTTSNFVSSGIASSDAAFGTITCSATSKCYSGKTGMGLKAGGSSAAGSFTITFSTPLVNVSKVTLNAAAYRSDKPVDITVTNGSTQLSKITSITNTTLYDIDIADLNIASFNTLTIESTKYCYIKSITITYNPSAGGETPDPTPSKLPTPANLKEASISETSATLSWDAVANASNYSVTINGNTETVTTNSYSATGLTAGTAYTWSVVAKGDGTNYTDSEAAEHTFTTTTATVTPEPGTGSETATATLIFDDTSKRTTSTTSQQIWEENGVVFTYDKADYGSNLADYSNPIRLYQGTTITIACSKGKITQIEFATNASKYVTPMVNSLSDSFGTVVEDGNNVTLTLNTPAEVIGAIALTAQVRLNSITVTYEKVASVEPTITCSNSVNFGVVSANVNTTKELVVEAENLTENITAVLTSGTNFAVSGDLTTAGGTLTLSVTATEEGTYTDKLTLTSGTTIKEVEVSATVVVCQGEGTEENPYTINDVIKLANPSPTITAWVEGYIVGVIINNKLAAPDSETNTNIVLATSATETEKFVPVALVGDIREALNLVDHSEYLGKKVAVYGTLENYYSTTGVKNVTDYQWVSTEGDVAAPVIEGDEYFEESTTITITAAEGTTIYYTIGETTPDKNANQYSESFTVNETKTINAIAYDANGNASEVTTKTFTKLSTLTCEAALNETAIDVNYIVKGYVTEINTAYSSSYNNITFSMADTQGGTPVLKAYRVKPKDTDDSTVQVGDLVKVIGKLTQFDGTNQIAQGGEYEILTESKNPIISGVETFADKTTVTITARDGLTIYYTLDNTDPTNGSNKYEAPFELTETKTVKAITYDGTSYSGIVEKTFTKTEIPTKTIAEFIAAGGTRCYLEGIVSNITNTTYGNFDLTDASDTIYVYGCLNAAGESKKFAELGVKNGDKIKVIADEYELYGGTKDEAKNVQYVSHISAATITIAAITMEVGKTKTISATVDPADAVVTYTIKENAENAISLNGNTITALAEGTATITATVAEGATYMGNSVDFTVTVTPESASDEVVILAEHNGQWYALKAATGSATNSLAALEVEYINGVLYNVAEADKASITWKRTVVGNLETFQYGDKYLKGSSSTNLFMEEGAEGKYQWDKNAHTMLIGSTNRTFLYQGTYFKNYAISNAGKTVNGVTYSALPVVTAAKFEDATIITRAELTTGNYGTICYENNITNFAGVTFYAVAGREGRKVIFDEVTELEAGMPYLFRAEATELKMALGNETATSAGNHNSLQGTFIQIEPAEENILTGNYVMYNNMIKKCGKNCGLKANRAYFIGSELESLGAPAPQVPGRKRVSMDVLGEDEATGVDNITENGVVAPALQGTYDVVGRQLVEPSTTGFYIVNGKKVLIVK